MAEGELEYTLISKLQAKHVDVQCVKFNNQPSVNINHGEAHHHIPPNDEGRHYLQNMAKDLDPQSCAGQ